MYVDLIKDMSYFLRIKSASQNLVINMILTTHSHNL